MLLNILQCMNSLFPEKRIICSKTSTMPSLREPGIKSEKVGKSNLGKLKRINSRDEGLKNAVIPK